MAEFPTLHDLQKFVSFWLKRTWILCNLDWQYLSILLLSQVVIPWMLTPLEWDWIRYFMLQQKKNNFPTMALAKKTSIKTMNLVLLSLSNLLAIINMLQQHIYSAFPSSIYIPMLPGNSVQLFPLLLLCCCSSCIFECYYIFLILCVSVFVWVSVYKQFLPYFFCYYYLYFT